MSKLAAIVIALFVLLHSIQIIIMQNKINNLQKTIQSTKKTTGENKNAKTL